MKLKAGFVLRNICDSYVVVAIGDRASKYKGMIKLNETGAFLWQHLQQDCTREQLLNAMVEEYDVEEAVAGVGIDSFIATLKDADVLE